MVDLSKLEAFPLIAEFVEALEDEAEDRVSAETLAWALTLFDLAALSAAIERSRVTFPEKYEGNVYDFLVEGGSGDVDAYNEVVLGSMDFAYVDSFARMIWNG